MDAVRFLKEFLHKSVVWRKNRMNTHYMECYRNHQKWRCGCLGDMYAEVDKIPNVIT